MPTPDDRARGSPGDPAPRPPAPIGPDNPGADIRIGYARCSSVKHYTRNFQHPLVDSMPLDNELMDLSNDKGQRMAVFTAEPDSPSAAALQFLADLSAGTFAPQQEQDHVPAGTVKRTALSHFRW
ncbi:MmyB family transcriptional regulator [Streptomyces atratus]|uniref:MmyB family transcriptional regulator n=1 Tax=Streptomyces atratus TaxID=1893 RepID=UPI0036537E44